MSRQPPTEQAVGTFILEPMDLPDIPEVTEIERQSFAVMWPSDSYRREVLDNRMARYVVLRYRPAPGESVVLPPPPAPRRPFPLSIFSWLTPPPEPDSNPDRLPVVGYAGLWMMVDDAHITTVAVRKEFRGQGLGKVLMLEMLEIAHQLGTRMVTLEVRVSNQVAIRMYEDLGFQTKGVRPRYYTDNKEDANIMWSQELQALSTQHGLRRVKEQLQRRVQWEVRGT